jgi:hypothetical protein
MSFPDVKLADHCETFRRAAGLPADAADIAEVPLLVGDIDHDLGSSNRADAIPTDATSRTFSCQPLPKPRSAADQGSNASVLDMYLKDPPNGFAIRSNDTFGFQIAKAHHSAGIRTNQCASR